MSRGTYTYVNFMGVELVCSSILYLVFSKIDEIQM